MTEFKSLKTLKYRNYENGLKIKKYNLLGKLAQGGLLVYTAEETSLVIHCRIVISDFSPNSLLQDIGKIQFPKSDRRYHYMFVGDRSTCSAHYDEIMKVLKELSDSSTGFETYKKFANETGKKDSYMFIESSKERQLVITFDYRVSYTDELASVPTEDSKTPVKPGKVNVPKPYFMFEPDKTTVLTTVTDQIKSWLEKTPFAEFKRAISQRVIGQDNLRLVLLNVYQYLQNVAADNFANRNNAIICAPSGCGKTETYRSLKAYFKIQIPMLVVSLIDTNQITSEGFRGSDTSAIVADLKKAGSNGIGIVFLDEFDKRLVPEYTSGGDDVDARIQAQLLETIEGYTINGVDTSKTLFIGMGSFNVIRGNRAAEKKIGFEVDRSGKPVEHYSDISRREMIEIGGTYELIGRFTSIINYYGLSCEALDQLINLRLREISAEVGFIVTVSDEMREFLHKNSNTEFGNRLIYSLIREPVNSAMAEILEFEIDAVGIVVTGEGQYTIERSPKDLVG